MTFYDYIRRPVRFDYLSGFLGREKNVKILDVGCGNQSPSITKRYYPDCLYHGVDRKDGYRNDDTDLQAMDAFFPMDLETATMTELQDGYYDCIILSHVIEHIQDGLALLRKVLPKLAAGGWIYIETPHERSLRLPKMQGTLNFWDDSTHVKVYTPREMVPVLTDLGCDIVRAGSRRSFKRILITPLHCVHALVRHGHLEGSIFWDITGFASVVIGRRNALNGRR